MGRRNMRAHLPKTMKSSLRRRVALTEVHTGVSVVSAWLLDSRGGCGVGVFIDGRLHLLQELVDVHQVSLGSQVWQGQGVLVLWHGTAMTSMMIIKRNHGWGVHVV